MKKVLLFALLVIGLNSYGSSGSDSSYTDDSEVVFKTFSNRIQKSVKQGEYTSKGTATYEIAWPVSGNPELVAEMRTWIATQLFYENSSIISQLVRLGNPTELLNEDFYSTLDFDLSEGLSYETIEVDVSVSENEFEYKITICSEILNSMLADRNSESKSFLKTGSFKLSRNMLPEDKTLSPYVWIGNIIYRNSEFDFLLEAERMKSSDNFWTHIEDWSKITIADESNVGLNEDGVMVSVSEYMHHTASECEVTIPYSVIWPVLSQSLKSSIPEKYLAKAFGDDKELDEKTVRLLFYTTAEGMLPTPLFEIIKTKFISASLSDFLDKAHQANRNIVGDPWDMTSLDWALGAWIENGYDKDDDGYIEEVTFSDQTDKTATVTIKYMNYNHPDEYIMKLVKEPMTMPNGNKANKWVIDDFSQGKNRYLRDRIIEAAKSDGVSL